MKGYVYDEEMFVGEISLENGYYRFQYDKSFEANGFYAYDDFMAFSERLGINKKMAESVIKDFLSKEKETLALLEASFLSAEAKRRYKNLFLDRVKAVAYQFEGKR